MAHAGEPFPYLLIDKKGTRTACRKFNDSFFWAFCFLTNWWSVVGCAETYTPTLDPTLYHRSEWGGCFVGFFGFPDFLSFFYHQKRRMVKVKGMFFLFKGIWNRKLVHGSHGGLFLGMVFAGMGIEIKVETPCQDHENSQPFGRGGECHSSDWAGA